MSTACSVHPSPPVVHAIMSTIVRLTVERIDRTRRAAGQTFAALLHSKPPVPHILEHPLLKDQLFPPDYCAKTNWGSDADVFPRVAKLLAVECYAKAALTGYAYSLGGVSEHLSASSKAALDAHLLDISEDGENLKKFLTMLLELFEHSTKSSSSKSGSNTQDKCVKSIIGSGVNKVAANPSTNDRLSLPLLKTIEHFITSSPLFDEALCDALALPLLAALQRAARGTKDFHRLVAIAQVMFIKIIVHRNSIMKEQY